MKFTPQRGKRDIFGGAQPGEEKARLIAALGHDIRAPLHVLSLSLQSLLSRVQDADTRLILMSAESALDEVSSLNDDLLDALRFGVGVTAPREEGISLSTLFADVRRRFHRRADVEGVRLKVMPTRIHCVADRHYLQRILGNLVDNAFKHGRAKRICVGARSRGYERVLIDVIDDGRGIGDQEAPFIFEEWFRGQAAVSGGARGQGLGLWTVRQCAEAMGGTVCVTSTVGRGTRFTVEFPTYAERREQYAALPDSALTDLQSKMVAILDDDKDVLRALRSSLEGIGARVLASADDLEFLTLVTSLERAPDLYLLDYNLGGRTVERALGILQSKYGPGVPVILITAHASESRLIELRKRYPIIPKPLSAVHLRAISEVLAGRRDICVEAFS